MAKPIDKPIDTSGKSLSELQSLSKRCTACHLYKNATQTVFGEGPKSAKVIFIGEQPGNDEDLEGHPFVGPAGRLLNGILEKVGLDRSQVYITNAVKHFKNERRGKIRLHKRPNADEINACNFWLQGELKNVKAKIVVCLGATAAQAYLGRAVKITAERGKVFQHLGRAAFITTHPSALLRMPDPKAKEAAYKLLTKELKVIKTFISKA